MLAANPAIRRIIVDSATTRDPRDTMTDDNHDHDQDLAERRFMALKGNEEMKETKQYLERGRRFASLDTGALNASWTSAFKTWFASRTKSDEELMNDLSAELRLRNLKTPDETVERELALGEEELQHGKINLKAKIAEFLDELDRDPN
jgi:hypothetical protein